MSTGDGNLRPSWNRGVAEGFRTSHQNQVVFPWIVGIGLDGDEIAVYLYLLFEARGDGHTFPKVSTIANHFNWKSSRTVHAKLSRLEEKGLLAIYSQFKMTNGTYLLGPEVADSNLTVERQSTNSYVLYNGQAPPEPPSDEDLARRRGDRLAGPKGTISSGLFRETPDSVFPTTNEEVQPVDARQGANNCTLESDALMGAKICTGGDAKNCTPITQSVDVLRIPLIDKSINGGLRPRQDFASLGEVDIRAVERKSGKRRGRPPKEVDEDSPIFHRLRSLGIRVEELTADVQPRGPWARFEDAQIRQFCRGRRGLVALIEKIGDEVVADLAAHAWRHWQDAPTWDSVVGKWQSIAAHRSGLRRPDVDGDLTEGGFPREPEPELRVLSPEPGKDYEVRKVMRYHEAFGKEVLRSISFIPGTDTEFDEAKWINDRKREAERV